jgi:hypothetical protein
MVGPEIGDLLRMLRKFTVAVVVLQVWCSRLTGILIQSLSRRRQWVCGQKCVQKTATGAARAGIPDGGGRWSRWGVPAKARTPLRSIPDLADLDYDASFVAVVGAVVDNGTVVGSIQKILKEILEELLEFVTTIVTTIVTTLVPASNRIEFHIVELNHIHDESLKRVECVNNIWGSKRTSASLLV